MNKLFTSAIVCLMILATPAFAQNERSSVNKAYVNLQQVFERYQPYKDAQDELEQFQKDLQKEIRNNRKKIQEMRKNMEESGDLLSKKQRRKKQQELMKEMQTFRQKSQRSEQLFERKQQEVLQPVLGKVRDAVQTTAEARGYDVVQKYGGTEQSILWVNSNVDITAAVISNLDNTTTPSEKNSSSDS